MDRNAPLPQATLYSFFRICQISQKRSHPTKWGDYIRSPATEPHADASSAENAVWPGSPRGSFTTAITTPQCYAAFRKIPPILAKLNQSRNSEGVS
jgi:hypothetical protein